MHLCALLTAASYQICYPNVKCKLPKLTISSILLLFRGCYQQMGMLKSYRVVSSNCVRMPSIWRVLRRRLLPPLPRQKKTDSTQTRTGLKQTILFVPLISTPLHQPAISVPSMGGKSQKNREILPSRAEKPFITEHQSTKRRKALEHHPPQELKCKCRRISNSKTTVCKSKEKKALLQIFFCSYQY